MGRPKKTLQKKSSAAAWKEREKLQNETSEEDSTSEGESAIEEEEDADSRTAAKKQGSKDTPEKGKSKEIKELLHQLRKDLKLDMEAAVAPLQTTLLEIKNKLEGVEITANAAMELAQGQEIKTAALETELSQLRDKVEDQENRNRRKNLRFRGFKEGEKGQELKAIILKWINELIPDLQITEMHLERVHRIGRKEISGRRRDIIIRFAYYTMKENVYKALRDIQDLTYEEEKIEIYQDLAPETIQKRRDWKKYTELLLKENIRYTWGFPFKLIIWDGRTPTVVADVIQLETFLERKKIQLPEGTDTRKPRWNTAKGRSMRK